MTDVRARYDNDAAAYVHRWAPVLRPAALPLLDRLPLQEASVVVEAACGSGGLMADLQARTRATVVGVDMSSGMLRVNPHTGRVVLGDVRRLPLADGCADVAVVAFALQHVAGPERAFAELARVLRPGGTLAVAAWGAEGPWPASAVVDAAYDALGAPPVESSRVAGHLTDTLRKLAALAEGAGLTVVAAEAGSLGWRPDVAELVGLWTSVGSHGGRFAALPEAQRPAARAALTAALEAMPPEALAPAHEVLRLWVRRA